MTAPAPRGGERLPERQEFEHRQVQRRRPEAGRGGGYRLALQCRDRGGGCSPLAPSVLKLASLALPVSPTPRGDIRWKSVHGVATSRNVKQGARELKNTTDRGFWGEKPYLLAALPTASKKPYGVFSSAHSSSATISAASSMRRTRSMISINRSAPMKCSAITRAISVSSIRPARRLTSP